MSKKKFILYLILLSLFILPFSFGNDFIGSISAQDSSLYKELELFTDAITLIQKSYVEDVEPRKIIYGALSGMLRVLDDYSQFLEPKMYEEMKVETEGKFGGIGAEVTKKDNYIQIITPIEGTPAAKAGLKPEDLVIKIDENSVKDITLSQAVELLRGKVGTKVKITVVRGEENKILEFELEREIIKIDSLGDITELAPGIGYIKIIQFQEGTAKELKAGMDRLDEKNIQSLILDLRNNPGGLLNEAIDVVDYFVKEDTLIVSTRGKLKEQSLEFKSKKKKTIYNKPLVILLNRGSASGSEIVAGAVQDLKRGIIVGERSFGKGSVQSIIPLRDGSAVRLTTAKYYTPSGRSIIKEGIVPDIILKNSEGKDQQLDRAVDILKGIMMYIDHQKSAEKEGSVVRE